jgi:hypothetical protein
MMTLIPVLLIIIGIVLLYSGIKGQNPIDLIKGVVS